MYYDMHTHSQFSTDSNMTLDGALEVAQQKNLSGIAFTDHLDLDFTNREDEYQFDVKTYFDTIDRYKAKFDGKIQILHAVEFGIQPHVIEQTKALLAGYSFDYILGSTHLIHRRDPYEPDYYDGLDKATAYREYLEELYRNIRLFHDFDVLAHLDYITRNAPYSDAGFYYRDYPAMLDEILKFIIDHGIGFEVNTSTYKKVPLDTDILKRYKELGGEIVTIGSDAHWKENVGQIFPEYLEVIKSCGFSYVAHYRDRKPVFDKII